MAFLLKRSRRLSALVINQGLRQISELPSRRAVPSTVQRIDEETFSGFSRSNYYAINIGDVIKEEYTVRVKLGFGRTSTTWLCTDRNHCYAVLKLSTASADESREARIFRALQERSDDPQKPGRYCVRRPETSFTIPANGSHHQCFVFQPLGPSLFEFASARQSKCFRIEEVRWMTIFILNALDYLHAHDVIHADLKLDNILLTLPENEAEFLSSFVTAEEENPSPVKMSADGLPVYQSREMTLTELTFPILCDLGSAVLGQAPHNGVVQALPYRAPEVILGAGWNFKIDIWGLGVLVWELAVGERLFDCSNETETLKLMVEYLGFPPMSLLLRSSEWSTYFDEHGYWKDETIIPIQLEDRVEVENEIPKFFDFLQQALSWDPNNRPSASELLQHPWLQLE